MTGKQENHTRAECLLATYGQRKEKLMRWDIERERDNKEMPMKFILLKKNTKE